MERARIKLTDPRNESMYKNALAECLKNKDSLNDRERSFVMSQSEGYNMFGNEYCPTVKQFNWLRQIAIDVSLL